MNVFHRYTWKSLKANRTRTLVTLVGIVLSIALITAVIQGAYSGVQYLIREEIRENGAYQLFYEDLNPQEVETAKGWENVEQAACLWQLGWADTEDLTGQREESFRSYLQIQAMDSNLPDLVALKLTDGRLPETSAEILLPERLLNDLQESWTEGQTLTLQVGQRTLNGAPLTEEELRFGEISEEERLENTQQKSYTVVGVYQENSLLGSIYSGSYPLLTVTGSAPEESWKGTLFLTAKDPTLIFNDMPTEEPYSQKGTHSTLLNYMGVLKNGNLQQVLYGFVAILLGLIVFGSVSLIYNSFSISVSQRTQQFGVLKSVGATRRQIRGSVLYEGLLLCVAAIPLGLLLGCGGIGLTLWLLRDSFTALMGSSGPMYLTVSLWGLLLAVGLGLVTTLISAWIPARRAIAVSPMEAIRQTRDVRLQRGGIRSLRLTRRLFGFEGLLAGRNFGRNRKRYRSTILSLFLSVTLFISASSFCSYLTGAVESVNTSSSGGDLIFYGGETDPQQALDLLLQAEQVTGGVYAASTAGSFCFPVESLSEQRLNLPEEPEINGADARLQGTLLFLDDASFRQLCRENGLEEQDYFVPEQPVALTFQQETRQLFSGEGDSRWYTYDVFDADQMPIEGRLEWLREFSGYSLYSIETQPDGSEEYLYIKNDTLERMLEQDLFIEQIPEEELLSLNRQEATQHKTVTIGALLPERPKWVSAGDTILLYPYSQMETVLEGTRTPEAMPASEVILMAGDTKTAYASACQLLEENGLDANSLYNRAAQYEGRQTLVTAVNVFSYGFIILISLIAVANVFNTLSTSMSLRRREFAMLRSVGMTQRSFRKMICYECMIYGCQSLLWGLPASVLVTYGIYRITRQAIGTVGFYIPWYSVVIAVASVFLVVFITMLYAARQLRKENLMEVLQKETL